MRIFTAGVWDLFHYGHLRLLERAKALGTTLIVGVSTDELVERYKGHKPLIPVHERFEIIKALKCVDVTAIQHELVEIALLKKCNPDIIVLGDDWEDKYIEGVEWFKSQGKEVVYLPYTQGISTSELAQKIKKEWG